MAHPQSFLLRWSGMGPRTCISNKSPCDADAAGPKITLQEPLEQHVTMTHPVALLTHVSLLALHLSLQAPVWEVCLWKEEAGRKGWWLLQVHERWKNLSLFTTQLRKEPLSVREHRGGARIEWQMDEQRIYPDTSDKPTALDIKQWITVSGWTSQNEHDPLQNNSHDYYTIIALLLPLELPSEKVTHFLNILNICWRSLEGGFPCSSVGKESACNVGDPGSIPGLWRSPGEGNGNPLQYPCLENLMDRGAR